MSKNLPSSRIPALDRVYARVEWLAYPLVRVVTGLFLVPHGAQKLFGFAGGDINATAATFGRLGLEPALPLATLGVLTRPAALAAATLLAVAAVHVHLPNGFFWSQGGFEYPAMWMLPRVAVVSRGSSPLPIDAARGRDA